MFYPILCNWCCVSWALDCLDEDLPKDFIPGWHTAWISRISVNIPSGIQLMEWGCSATAGLKSGSGPISTSKHYPLSGKAKEEFSWAGRSFNTVKHIRITVRINISHISSGPCIESGLEKAPSVFLGFSVGCSSLWKLLCYEMQKDGYVDAMHTCIFFNVYQGRSKEVEGTPGGGRTGFRGFCWSQAFYKTTEKSFHPHCEDKASRLWRGKYEPALRKLSHTN